ncbi:hypothetical protein BO70DRAFT_361099 [Aspergillus heteromorphus CBS 117.55]|uniref:Uncharacterized protein n=1 Tax=Aspergillus heteromorphus CBS 117.55 TaxID=1448321 RepID=A0A317WIY1_9EURO|nr:uncharacterized protein BO70DRAFT_361099 [Aspergillus heteromorphus CBS 117.55]PWY86269.1 hypothetical protein BO70DRAFT_361099 [Aspergillus heteromorphus CBS 117.55]
MRRSTLRILLLLLFLPSHLLSLPFHLPSSRSPLLRLYRRRRSLPVPVPAFLPPAVATASHFQTYAF